MDNPQPLQRLRVADGMLINSDRWQIAHDYHRRRQNLLYQSLFTGGIITGLGVCPIPAPEDVPARYRDGRWIQIQAGIAIDSLGNFIIVPSAIEFRLASQPGPTQALLVYLILSYVDPETLLGNGADILRETFRINEKTSPPSVGEIELCRITLGAGLTTGVISISAPQPTYYPQVNQLDLRFRPRAKWRSPQTVAIGVWSEALYQGCLGLVKALPALTQELQAEVSLLDQKQSAWEQDVICLSHAEFSQLLPEQRQAIDHYQTQGGLVLIEYPLLHSKLGELLLVKNDLETALDKLGKDSEFANLRQELATELEALNATVQQQTDLIFNPCQTGQPWQAFSAFSPHHPLRTQPFLFTLLPQVRNLTMQIWGCGSFMLVIGDLTSIWGGQLEVPRETIRSIQELGVNLLNFGWHNHHIQRMTTTPDRSFTPDSQRQITNMPNPS